MGHIQVPAKDNGLLAVQLPDIAQEGVLPLHPVRQPPQAVLGVGHVGAHQEEFRIFQRDDPAFMVEGVLPDPVADRQRFLFRENRGAGVAFLFRVVPELVIAGQLHLDLSLLQLCFLQAEKIRVQLFKSFHKALAHHRAQAVHVPGYHLHRSFTPFFSFSAVPARVFYHK